MLPERLVPALTDARLALRLEHARARVTGGGYYPLPEAMVDKLPNALCDWRWGWVFPARHDVYDRQRGRRVRPPVHITTIQRAIAMAGVAAGINRRVADHTFRHSFATQLLRSGYDIRTVQELLGHADVTTTIVYLHVLDRGPGVRSPFDQLPSSTTPAMPPAPTGTHCDYPQFPRCDKPGRPILPQCATTVATRACRRLAALLQRGYAASDGLDKTAGAASSRIIRFY